MTLQKIIIYNIFYFFIILSMSLFLIFKKYKKNLTCGILFIILHVNTETLQSESRRWKEIGGEENIEKIYTYRIL